MSKPFTTTKIFRVALYTFMIWGVVYTIVHQYAYTHDQGSFSLPEVAPEIKKAAEKPTSPSIPKTSEELEKEEKEKLAKEKLEKEKKSLSEVELKREELSRMEAQTLTSSERFWKSLPNQLKKLDKEYIPSGVFILAIGGTVFFLLWVGGLVFLKFSGKGAEGNGRGEH